VAVKAIVLSETGGPEKLELRDVAEPEGNVIEVRAAGVNFADALIRGGRYPQAPELPIVLGSEVAGDLDGRRVLGLTRLGGGGYAERAAVDPEWVFPLPEGATYAEGAAFPLTFLTAYIPLVRLVRRDATVLVHAAAGGVGTAAVQLARHLGARVVATAGSAEKRELARGLGAEETYGYDEFAGAVRADVVIDPVGGSVFADSLRALNPRGVAVAIGYAGGQWEHVDPALLVGRNIGIEGFYLGRLMTHEPALVQEAAFELLALWEQGAIRPVVGAEIPLAEAARAHELIESRRSVGKLVLLP
jgi:NADPH:quinone reductase